MLPLQIFVLSSSRIQQRGYDTLFNYTTANPKSGVSKFVKQFPLKRQVHNAVACSMCGSQLLSQACLNALFLLVPSTGLCFHGVLSPVRVVATTLIAEQ